MGFMQRNVNVFLVLLVLVLAASLAASSVYYQKTFSKINSEKEDALGKSSSCQADLDELKFSFNKTMQSLNETSQDIRRYDELYSSKTEELSQTKGDLESTKTNLQETTIQLQQEINLKERYKSDYEEKKQIADNLEEQNAILTSQKAQLEIDERNCNINIEEANTCIDDVLIDHPDLSAAVQDDIATCKQ